MKLKVQTPTLPDVRTLWQFAVDSLISGLQLHKGTLSIPSMTEAQRDTLDASNGMAVNNEDVDRVQFYDDGQWVQVSMSVTTVTSTSHTAGDKHLVLVDDDTSGGDVTVTMPTAVGIDGAVYHIKKLGTTGNVIVDGAGAETIDGAATQTIVMQYDSLMLVSDGSGWVIV